MKKPKRESTDLAEHRKAVAALVARFRAKGYSEDEILETVDDYARNAMAAATVIRLGAKWLIREAKTEHAQG